MGQVNLKGKPISLEGIVPKVGDEAPDFVIVGEDTAEYSLRAFSEKVKVLLAVPSLDTPVCAKQTRIFGEQLGAMPDVKLITISGDLPFAMKRFCTTEGLKNVFMGSQYRDMNFSKTYGTHITEGGLKDLSTRAVFIVDEKDIVRYVELVPEITEEPDYNKAMEAVKNLL